jgi:hypothetical protein
MVGVVLALIELVYVIISYENLYQFSNTQSFSLLMVIAYSLVSPFIATGVALFLMILIEPKKGAASWSILIFFCGTVLFMLSGLLSVILQYEILYDENWPSSYDFWINLSLAGIITNILGIFFCTIAGLLLVRAYLKGEIRAKPKESSNL